MNLFSHRTIIIRKFFETDFLLSLKLLKTFIAKKKTLPTTIFFKNCFFTYLTSFLNKAIFMEQITLHKVNEFHTIIVFDKMF